MIKISKISPTQKNRKGEVLDNNFPLLDDLPVEELINGILVGQNKKLRVIDITSTKNPVVETINYKQEMEIFQLLRKDEFLLANYSQLPKTLYLTAETRQRSWDDEPMPMISLWDTKPTQRTPLSRVSYDLPEDLKDFISWSYRPRAFRLFFSRVVYYIRPREIVSDTQWAAARRKYLLSHQDSLDKTLDVVPTIRGER